MTMYCTKNLTPRQESVLWRICEDTISIEEAVAPKDGYIPNHDVYTIVGARLWFNSKNRRRLLTHLNHVIEECEEISANSDMTFIRGDMCTTAIKVEELYDAVCDCVSVEV